MRHLGFVNGKQMRSQLRLLKLVTPVLSRKTLLVSALETMLFDH